MITVEISEEVAVKLLMDRVYEYIQPSLGEAEVWEMYYTQLVNSGRITKLDPKVIVDNDEQRFFCVYESELESECGVTDLKDERILATNGTFYLVDMTT